jgi:hypothetical protein
MEANSSSVDKGLDVAQPAHIFTLLFDVDVVGDEDGEGLVNAPFLEEALHNDLQVIVEATKWRARINVGAALSSLGRLDLCNGGILEIEEVLNDNIAVLGGGVDVEGASSLAGLLDEDGQVDGRGGLLVELLLGVLVQVLLGALARTLLTRAGQVLSQVLLILESGILVVGVVVGDIGDGEADSDPATC